MTKNDHSGRERRMIERSSARHQQAYTLLLSRRDFQKDIADLRDKWDIPSSGLKTNEQTQAWWDQHHQNADKYSSENHESNRREMLAARKKMLNTDIAYLEYEAVEKAVNLRNPINALWDDINSIVGKYNLPPKWRDTIRAFLITNDEKYHGLVGIGIKAPMDDIGEDQVEVSLDAFIKKQDLMDAWPDIKFHLDKLKHKKGSKFQPIDMKKFGRDKRAHELKEKGYKLAKIAEIIMKEYPDPDPNKVITYSEVQTMIRNYKDKLGIN